MSAGEYLKLPVLPLPIVRSVATREGLWDLLQGGSSFNDAKDSQHAASSYHDRLCDWSFIKTYH